MAHPYRETGDAWVDEIERLRRELRDVDAHREELRCALASALKAIRPRFRARRPHGLWLAGGVAIAVGILVALAIEVLSPRSFRCHHGQIDGVKTDCRTLVNVIDTWRMNGHDGCPTFEALKNDRVLRPDQRVTDPWGNRYEIFCDVEKDVIVSAGPDGQWGTGDDLRADGLR